MHTPSHQPDRRFDLPRVPCAFCEHSEFVHGDAEPRRCLYTECHCVGFIQSFVA
jgi:hypothetical protein